MFREPIIYGQKKNSHYFTRKLVFEICNVNIKILYLLSNSVHEVATSKAQDMKEIWIAGIWVTYQRLEIPGKVMNKYK
jgi:hypothetical protein